MNLLETARALWLARTTDQNGFAMAAVFTSPANHTAHVNVYHARHQMGINELGQTVNANQAHVTVVEQALLDASYTTRDTNGKISLTGHRVTITYPTNEVRNYQVQNQYPNETIKTITLILTEYKS